MSLEAPLVRHKLQSLPCYHISMNDPAEGEIDELGVIAAIYPREVRVDRCNGRLTISSDEQSTEEMVVIHSGNIVSLPLQRFEISAPSMEADAKKRLKHDLTEMLAEKDGRPLHEIVEYILDFFKRRRAAHTASSSTRRYGNETARGDATSSICDKNAGRKEEKFLIFSGEPMEDRKSVFQAHVARIKSRNEAMHVLEKLKENGKIAKATHNIYAWRTSMHTADGRRVEQHDCDDDGEHGAGPKLLHLITMMKVNDLIVVVTRWYGGRQLGPDRFRHICNVARECITQFGFVRP